MKIYNNMMLDAVRACLRRPRHAALLLEEKRGRVAALETLTEQVQAHWGLRSGPCDARLGEVLGELIRLRGELLREVLEYTALVREVERLLKTCLPDARHRAVMEAHYLGFATWEATAEQVGYAPRHVHRLHREALSLIAAHPQIVEPAGAARVTVI